MRNDVAMMSQTEIFPLELTIHCIFVDLVSHSKRSIGVDHGTWSASASLFNPPLSDSVESSNHSKSSSQRMTSEDDLVAWILGSHSFEIVLYTISKLPIMISFETVRVHYCFR